VSRKMEMREVEVITCDFCKKEVTYVEKCSICGLEGCSGGGGTEHFAFSGEIFRYKDRERKHFRVCNSCDTGHAALVLNLLFKVK